MPIHLAPANAADESPANELSNRTIVITNRGAGFGDAETNGLVEAAAMRAATEQYAEWEFDDVSSAKCGWDITFRSGDKELHVEVKGVSGYKPKIFLTPSRVDGRAARSSLATARRHAGARCTHNARFRT